MTGKFIVLEGIDGCGKGTQAKMLAARIFSHSKSNAVLMTREPTGLTDAGKELRIRLKNDKNPKQNGELYSRLFIEDRKQHVKNIIDPAIEKGIHVVCDRFKHSTMVYQETQGGDFKSLIEEHKGLSIPDMTIIIDVQAQIALQRITTEKEVFEEEHFLNKLREKYRELQKKLPGEKIMIIDGIGTPEEIHEKIWKELEKLL